MRKMISVDDARNLISEHCMVLGVERVELLAGLGGVLFDDVFSAIDMPGFAQSAMDGYALNWAGYGGSGALTVVGEMAAGASEGLPKPAPNQAIRIFTGAPLPEGLDTVVMQEKVKLEGDQLFIEDAGLLRGKNVRPVGSEIKQGDLALAKGTQLTPAGIGFLASLGITHVNIFKRPLVAVIVTGNELQKPGNPLGFGQVYESNSQMLQAAVMDLRFPCPELYYAKDDLGELAAVIERAAEHHDVVLLTGGVSVGDYDFVVQASTQVGVEGVFHKIKQKPGKPIFFGHRTSNQTGQSTVIFGLPGNPGSVMTCFYLYVRPALVKMSGMPTLIGSTSAQFNDSYSKPIGMTHFLKGVYDRELGGNSLPSVRLLGAQESYRLSSFSVANCLIEIPEDRSEIAAGTSVIVHLFA